jgi:hypothetical protein
VGLVEDLKSLLGRQVEYLARYGGIMTDIMHTLAETVNHLYDGFITLPYVHFSYQDKYIHVNKRLDLPRWFSFYFYHCREPILKSIRFLPSSIEFTFECGKSNYDVHVRMEGEIDLYDALLLVGLPDDVWDIMLSEAKKYHDVARNLGMLYDLATEIGEMVFSITPEPSITYNMGHQTIDTSICEDEVAKLATAFKIVEDIQCKCIDENYWLDIMHALSTFPVRLFTKNNIDNIHSYRVFNKPIDGKVPEWLSNARSGYVRNYKTLSKVFLENTDIIIWLEYEYPDNNKDVEIFYFVSSGKVSLDDLILASYVLDDDVWDWILKEAMDFLALAREANMMIRDYIVPMARLVA